MKLGLEAVRQSGPMPPRFLALPVEPLQKGISMKKIKADDFLQNALKEIDALPDGFEQQLLRLVNSAPTQRRERIRKLFSEVTSA